MDKKQDQPPICGRVMEEQKNYFVIDTSPGRLIATTSGSLKKWRTRVCSGDMVDVTIIDAEKNRALITSIHKRTSCLRRPSLANCSHLLCVCTLSEPPLNLEALDRLLFSSSAHGLEPLIVFNKVDLVCAEEQKRRLCEVMDAYGRAGYRLFRTSAHTAEGVGEIVQFCTGRICAFAGLSGVGKSTLLSSIFPEIEMRIGALSFKDTRGTHTTTNVTLLPLPGGGYIADTPGLAMIDIPDLAPQDVAAHFPEIAACTGRCRFNDCVHDNEPDCFVTAEVASGAIAPWRHAHYLAIYREMEKRQQRYR